MHIHWLLAPVLAVCCLIAACSARQPDSWRTVAAFEIPLSSEADREEFLLVLKGAAEAEGMHVDLTSSQDLRAMAQAIPQSESTVRAAVWRGSKDDEPVATAMDLAGHLGRIWLTFAKGEDPSLNNRFQQRAMSEIIRHWPSTLSLPVMPTGATPLPQDLIKTKDGYIVNPSEAHKYQLKDGEDRNVQ